MKNLIITQLQLSLNLLYVNILRPKTSFYQIEW